MIVMTCSGESGEVGRERRERVIKRGIGKAVHVEMARVNSKGQSSGSL